MFKAAEAQLTIKHPFVLSFIMVVPNLHWLTTEREILGKNAKKEKRERERQNECVCVKQSKGNMQEETVTDGTDGWD